MQRRSAARSGLSDRFPAIGRPLIPLTILLWGLQFSFLGPSLALILVNRFGATPGEVGLVLATYNSFGFLASLTMPAAADRKAKYLPLLLLCSILSLALGATLAVTRSLPAATIALVVLGGPAAVGISLVFAHLRYSGATPKEVVSARAVFSFAWVVGPPVATALIAAMGIVSIPIAIAAIAAANVLTALALLRTTARLTHDPDSDDHRTAPRPAVPIGRIAIIFAAFVLASATNSAAIAVTTLFVSAQLGLPVVWAGIALGVAAGLEIPALMIMSRLSSRCATVPLLITGCVAGIAYYAALIVTTDPVMLISLQPLNAWFYASLAGLGLTLFQDQVPGPGLATGLFSNTMMVGAVVAGGVLFAAEGPWGYTGVFGANVLLMVGATVLMLAAGRRRPATS